MSESKFESIGNADPIVGAIATPIMKRDVPAGEASVLQSNALNEEIDPFESLYKSELQAGEVSLIRPSYNPLQLYRLTQQNNTLSQCIAAMEVNIDGTGFEITNKNGENTDDDPAAQAVTDFFNEPYPDISLITMRRRIRRDLESTGNAYIEAIRNQKGEVTILNKLDAKITRMVRLENQVVVDKKIMRGGAETTVRMAVRERRFAQLIGKKVVYFKEYSGAQNVDKRTGKFDSPEHEVPPEWHASEIIHLKVDDDVLTPYGVPRWINNVPSVLGSRKAEEFNLEFFDHGGLPPAMVMIQGGQLTSEARTTLTNYLSGKAKFKQRAIMLESFGMGGDLNSSSSVRITVERFGAERQNDSMFEKYDERCAQRVRVSFRLPPLFLGMSQDYNFATAITAYMVAEAQIFQPERTEFDDMINIKIMRQVAPNYRFRSLPLTVKDIESQLKALELAKDVVEADGFVDAINELADLNLQYQEPEEPEVDPLLDHTVEAARLGNEALAASIGATTTPPKEGEDETPIAKIMKMDDELLRDLANDWTHHLSGEAEFAPSNIVLMKNMIELLAPPVRKMFNGYIGMKLANPQIDPEGVSELLACAAECEH